MLAQLTAEDPQLAVRHLCALLGVSRSWFYATQQTQQPDARAPALRAALE
jgi:predicted DNA-binding transcriptional regulator AlpA